MAFKRFYAFEAEGVSDAVKTQLEAVEKAADDKCDTPEACDKILDKIDDQAEKFNDALSTMAGAAKDCKDGKCSSDDMAVRITPAQAELKEVAKTIGVASEAEGVTEEELKDVKDYLEGAKEIVEAKKDELGEGGSSEGESGESKSDEKKEESDMNCGNESAIVTVDDVYAMESFGLTADEVDFALEAYMDALDDIGAGAITMAAMEGANMDAIGTLKNYLSESKSAKSEMKAAAKSGDYKTAAAKAREVAAAAGRMQQALNDIPPSTGSAVLVTIALAMVALAVAGVTGKLVGKAAGKVGEMRTNGLNKKVDKALDRMYNGAEKKGDAKIFEKAANAGTKAAANKAAAAAKEDAKAAARAKLEGMKGGKTLAKIGDTAKVAAAGGRIAAGVGIASIPGVSGLANLLKKNGATDANGNPQKANINDVNALITAMKGAASGLKKHYEKLAQDYDRMASSGSETTATEAFDIFFGRSDYEAAIESELNGTSAGAGDADFSGFIEACESLTINTNAGNDVGSFLFN